MDDSIFDFIKKPLVIEDSQVQEPTVIESQDPLAPAEDPTPVLKPNNFIDVKDDTQAQEDPTLLLDDDGYGMFTSEVLHPPKRMRHTI